MTRVRMSRPKWSVPNQLTRVGRVQAQAEIVAQRIERREPVGAGRDDRDRQHDGAADQERAMAQQPRERLARSG